MTPKEIAKEIEWAMLESKEHEQNALLELLRLKINLEKLLYKIYSDEIETP